MKKLLLFILWLTYAAKAAPVFGQVNIKDSLPIINVAAIADFIDLPYSDFELAYRDKALFEVKRIPGLQYVSPARYLSAKGRLADSLNNKHLYVKINLANPSDSLQELYLYAGFYYKSKHLFRESRNQFGGGIVALPDVLPDMETGDHYRRIRLRPGDTSSYYIQLQPVSILGNKVDLQLLRPHFLSMHGGLVKKEKNDRDIITYMLVGVLFMMLLFSLAYFILSWRLEFLYYCLYATFTGLLLFFKTYLYHSASDFNYFFEEYLDFVFLVLGIIFYVYFVRYFLETETKYPLLDKIMHTLEVLNICFIVVYSGVYFVADNIVALDYVEVSMKAIMLITGCAFVIFGFREKDRLVSYIVAGTCLLAFFSCISLIVSVSSIPQRSVFTDSMFYYDMGIVLEMAFFLQGLTYKSRMELIEKMKLENAAKKADEKRSFEQQLAIIKAQQEERNRISADMHDELGGGMTAIRLMSEIAKQRGFSEKVPEIEKISVSANDLLGKMNAIIWSMNLANDSLANLVAYIRSYALEFFESTDINCHVLAVGDPPELQLSGIKRRNIFFAVREILQNTLRYEDITKVDIFFEWVDGLVVVITDNGTIIPSDKLMLEENTISQVKNRMAAIDGGCETRRFEGSTIVLRIPL